MDINYEVSPAAGEFVDALLQSHGQLALIVEQMLAYPHTAPDALPIPVVLHGLIGEILEDVVARHGDEAFATAAHVLRDAIEAVGQNLYFVDPNWQPNRAERRANRRRGHC